MMSAIEGEEDKILFDCKLISYYCGLPFDRSQANDERRLSHALSHARRGQGNSSMRRRTPTPGPHIS